LENIDEGVGTDQVVLSPSREDHKKTTEEKEIIIPPQGNNPAPAVGNKRVFDRERTRLGSWKEKRNLPVSSGGSS